jgi:MraZ protein
MADAVANGKMTYNGCYRHKVDDKGRLPVPFRWRPEQSIEFTLTIWPQHKAGTCLRVLLPEQWAKLLADIDAMPSKKKIKSVLKRRIGTSSAQAKLDSVGRITIPNDMAKAAGITNEAVLAGMIDRFEIWSPERYDKSEALDNALLGKALEMME